MRVDVIIDVVCPWCYIGKKQLDSAVAQRAAIIDEIIYHPYQLGPDTPPEGVDRKEYYARKFGNTAEFRAAREHMQLLAEALGISFNWDIDARIPNTLDAHRLIRWASGAGCADAVVDDLMYRYFTLGQFLGDHDLLAGVASAAGMDGDLVRSLLATERDSDRISADVAQARQMGVTGVPCFYFDGRGPVSGAQDASRLVQIIDQVIALQQQEAGQTS